MQVVKKDHRLSPFIKEIFLLESDIDERHGLPFYADGYPGLIFSETNKEVLLLPNNKLLPNFFLYGQTIEPIELQIDGPYKLIVFQLYPFATRLLLNINPIEINDKCYDLRKVENVDTEETISQLVKSNTSQQVNFISEYLLKLVKTSAVDPDNAIKLAVSSIIDAKGNIKVKELREQLYITERTFERRFNKEIGVTPKQFAKIIQFSFSLNQIQETDYTNLTNVAYENGFSDQSHFIRCFKRYTGETPKEVLARLDV